MKIVPIRGENLHDYLDFRCSRCCYWTKGREFEDDPDGWKTWHQFMVKNFGPPVLAAYDSGTPVGMVMYSPLDLAPHPGDIEPFDIWNRIPEDEHHLSLFLYCIFVPDCEKEGLGIGRALISFLIHIFKSPHPYLSNGRFRWIYTIGARGRPGPSGPSSFFEKFGFKTIETLEETCLLMRLDLKS